MSASPERPRPRPLLPPAVRVGLWMSLTAAGFAALLGITRYLSAEMDVVVIFFWRNCIAVLIFLPWLARVGTRGLVTRRAGLYVVRAAFMVVASLTILYAVVWMPVAEVTALSFTTPLFAAVLAVALLEERPGLRRWSALAVGFAGMLVILRPGLTAFDPVALLVVVSAFTFAMVIVTGKMLAASESPELIVVYLSLFSIPISLLPALTAWQWPSAGQWPWLAALALAANANMYGIARALRLGDASLAMVFDFLRLPATALVGYLAFAERVDAWSWLGGAIIVASAAYIARREALTREAGAPQPPQPPPPPEA